jgi:hypothetical protein
VNSIDNKSTAMNAETMEDEEKQEARITVVLTDADAR